VLDLLQNLINIYMFLGFFYFIVKMDLNNKLHTKKFFSMLYLRSPLKIEKQ
tara:strand:- start:5112 stop:5264 length:153 start_codon:yes stop_codon:yes gene_type:complete